MSALEPRQRGRRSISKRDRERFLGHLAAGGTVLEAAKLTGRSRDTFYELRKHDEEFAKAWDAAHAAGTEVMEGEANRRSIDGYYVERYDGDGKLLWREHRHDNTLLAFMLRGRKPDVYGNAPKLEITGAVRVAHEARLTLADLAAFGRIEGQPEILERASLALTVGTEVIEGELVGDDEQAEHEDDA